MQTRTSTSDRPVSFRPDPAGDEPAEADVVIGDDGGPVLAISAELAPRLDGLVFDWIVSEVRGLGPGGLSFRPRLDEEPDLIGPADS